MFNLAGYFYLFGSDQWELVPVFIYNLFAYPKRIIVNSLSIFLHTLTNFGLFNFLGDSLNQKIIAMRGEYLTPKSQIDYIFPFALHKKCLTISLKARLIF